MKTVSVCEEGRKKAEECWGSSQAAVPVQVERSDRDRAYITRSAACAAAAAAPEHQNTRYPDTGTDSLAVRTPPQHKMHLLPET